MTHLRQTGTAKPVQNYSGKTLVRPTKNSIFTRLSRFTRLDRRLLWGCESKVLFAPEYRAGTRLGADDGAQAKVQ